MKYLIVLKQETGTGRFVIKTSEGAYVSTQKDFVEVNNKEGHIEFLIPAISVLFIEAIDKEEDCEKEAAKEEDKELTSEDIDILRKEKEKIIDKALKKFFNL